MKKGMRVLVFDEDRKSLKGCKLVKKLWSRIRTDKNGYRWKVERWIVRMEKTHLITLKYTVESFDFRVPELEQVALCGE